MQPFIYEIHLPSIISEEKLEAIKQYTVNIVKTHPFWKNKIIALKKNNDWDHECRVQIPDGEEVDTVEVIELIQKVTMIAEHREVLTRQEQTALQAVKEKHHGH